MFLKSFIMSFIAMTLFPSRLFAVANEAKAAGYLEYKEPAVAASTSASSTFFYSLGLIVVFLLILFSAYIVSKFLGGKIGSGGLLGSKSILGTIPLGQNKNVLFLEVADSVLVLGVTEQSISLLKEVVADEDIKKIKEDLVNKNMSKSLLGYQSQTLNGLQKKLKPILRKLPGGEKGDVRE